MSVVKEIIASTVVVPLEQVTSIAKRAIHERHYTLVRITDDEGNQGTGVEDVVEGQRPPRPARFFGRGSPVKGCIHSGNADTNINVVFDSKEVDKPDDKGGQKDYCRLYPVESMHVL